LAMVVSVIPVLHIVPPHVIRRKVPVRIVKMATTSEKIKDYVYDAHLSVHDVTARVYVWNVMKKQ